MDLPPFHPKMLTPDERREYRRINGRRLTIVDRLRELSPRYGDVFLKRRAGLAVSPAALEIAETLKSLSAERKALQQEVSALKLTAQRRHAHNNRLTKWKGVQPINATFDWTKQ